MSLAILHSIALIGVEAVLVKVEVHIGPGLPSFNVVGLPDAGIRESRDRIRAAIVNSGFDFPIGRITANLAPADLPKESSRYDLPIAIGVLLASGQIALPEYTQQPITAFPLSRLVFAGELSLTGTLVPVSGALAMALGLARQQSAMCFVLPKESATVVTLIPQFNILSARTLSEVCGYLCGQENLAPEPPPSTVENRATELACLSDVKGQDLAKRALIIAATGGHSVLMSGSPGSGKSMLAQRLVTLLPPLEGIQALEVAAIHQLHNPQKEVVYARPFRAPHHSSSMVAMIGGGSKIKLGEISLAHHGILFLDELPEFQRSVLESLREPLEAHQIHLARAAYRVTFPAHFQLVAAMNPCPCGWLGHAKKPCVCTPDRIAKYRTKVSGPLLDRIDLLIQVQPLNKDWLDQTRTERSSDIRELVEYHRGKQLHRQSCLNSELAGEALLDICKMNQSTHQMWLMAMDKWSWSGRVAYRILKVARTIADMSGSSTVLDEHLAESFQYRLW